MVCYGIRPGGLGPNNIVVITLAHIIYTKHFTVVILTVVDIIIVNS